MARSGPLLTEAQGKKIAPLLPKLPKHHKGGRPWIENRRVLEGILWILRSGARWQDLSENYPHPSTCWRRLRDWDEQGVWLRLWRVFLSELNERQQLQWSESFLDGSFAPAKKRGCAVGKTKRGKETKWMVGVDGAGLPLGDSLHSASPSEVRLAEATIRVGWRHHAGWPRPKPLQVIADKGYDSDARRARLRRRGILLIAPHRSNRHRTPPQDGRMLRRYKRRWTVERTSGWLGNSRRLVVR